MNIKMDIWFLYGSFEIFESDCPAYPDFTAKYSEQGFARLTSYACFTTLTPDGTGHLKITDSAFVPSELFDRAISVPIFLPKGECMIGSALGKHSSFAISPGHYKLVVAQKLLSDQTGDGEENITLFFERIDDSNSANSEILIRDSELTAQILVETCETLPS